VLKYRVIVAQQIKAKLTWCFKPSIVNNFKLYMLFSVANKCCCCYRWKW